MATQEQINATLQEFRCSSREEAFREHGFYNHERMAIAIADSRERERQAVERAEKAEVQLAAMNAALAELALCPDMPHVQYGVSISYPDGAKSIMAVRGDEVIGVFEAIHAHVKTLAPFGEQAVQAVYQVESLRAERDALRRVDDVMVERAVRASLARVAEEGLELYADNDEAMRVHREYARVVLTAALSSPPSPGVGA